MKKIKLLTSLSSLGLIATATPLAATSCSKKDDGGEETSSDVKVTKAHWTTLAGISAGTYAEAEPTTNSGAFILVPSLCTYDNTTFATELEDKGVYEIGAGESAADLGANVDDSSGLPVISIVPTKDGTHKLELNVTLNKTAAEYGKGGEGKKYTVTCSVTVKEGVPYLDMPNIPCYSPYGAWYPFESANFTGVQGTVGVNVTDASTNNTEIPFDFWSVIPQGITPEKPMFNFYTVDISTGVETETTFIEYTESAEAINVTNGTLTIKSAFYDSIGTNGRLICMTLTDGKDPEVLAKSYFGIYNTNSYVEIDTTTATATSDNVKLSKPYINYTNNGTNGTFTVQPTAKIKKESTGELKFTASIMNDEGGLSPFDGVTATYTPPSKTTNALEPVADTGKITVTLVSDKLSPKVSNLAAPDYVVVINCTGYKNNFVAPYMFPLNVSSSGE